MKNWFKDDDAADLLRRLDGLTLGAPPRWGTLTPAELVCHLTDPVRVALGEKQAAPVRSTIGLPGIADMVVWVLPWPKGAPTAPEFLPGTGMTAPGDFERDKAALVEALQRFSAVPPDRAPADNPVFGRLSRAAWGRLMWRHIDHHLRQFGI